MTYLCRYITRSGKRIEQKIQKIQSHSEKHTQQVNKILVPIKIIIITPKLVIKRKAFHDINET